MVINRTAALLLLLLPLTAVSQNRYFVSFKDKASTPYTLAEPLQFLSQKSLDRRARENFQLTSDDLPVDTAYVNQVRKTGAAVFFTSRWLNGVLIQTDAITAGDVSGLSCVSKVELVGWGAKLTGGRKSANSKWGQTRAASALQNEFQLQTIGLDAMQAAGYHGEGVDVAIFDAGFIGVNNQPAFQAISQEGRLKAVFNFVNNSTDVYSAHYHGTEVLSIVAGDVAGTYLGGASKANFFLFQTEDVTSEYRVEEYNWLFAAERADSIGVDVINSSLGYNQFDDSSMDYTYADMDGKTSVAARAASRAVQRGMLVVNSAGNEGSNSWKYIITPADAEGVIACGAVDYSGKQTSFSSIGPSADRRIKPDVAALGSGSVVITQYGAIASGDGTSFSSPLVASLVIGLRQALPMASAKDIYQRIINSASQSRHPDDMLGYGIPNFTLAKNNLDDFDGEFQFYPNPVTDGVLKVIFKSPSDETLHVTIFTASGQRVSDFTDVVSWGNNPYAIDLSGLSSGLYLVKAQTSSASLTIRIVR